MKEKHYIFFAFFFFLMLPLCRGNETLILPDSVLEIQLKKLWAEEKTSRKEKIVRKILSSDPGFDNVYSKLKGRNYYPSEVKRGFYEYPVTTQGGLVHSNLVFIPYNYSPQKKYNAEVFLHGGVSTPDPRFLYTWFDQKDTSYNQETEIQIIPAAWAQSRWWDFSQYENITSLLNYIKTFYNVDENRIHLLGISDGGIGSFFIAGSWATPWSVFIPLIGSLEWLSLVDTKQSFLINFSNTSLFIINGALDKTFPIELNLPYYKVLSKVARDMKLSVIDTSGHSIRWIPVMRDSIIQFIRSHPRNPFPDTIKFATDKTDSMNRCFWVKVTKIGHIKGESELEDINSIDFQGQKLPAYYRTKPFGQIEVIKNNNQVFVRTKGVKEYSLLLSPDQFDFSIPVKIITNNVVSFEGLVRKDLQTLLLNYLTDMDRTFLIGNELKISLPD